MFIDNRDNRTLPFNSAEFGNAWAVHRGKVFQDHDLTPFQREWQEWLANAKAEAWLEGHTAGRDYQGDGWNADSHDPDTDNPYRTGGGH
jgi:hypothetical protein